MKLVISSSELLKGLMTISKAIPAKTTEAILEDYLFVLNGNRLEVTASDKEITMKTTIEVETPEEEGRIAVPARQLNDLLKIQLHINHTYYRCNTDCICNWKTKCNKQKKQYN